MMDEKKVAKILLVEDARAAQLVATKMLQSYFFFVDTADNGTRALELAMKNKYDLIFMDIGLPEAKNFGLIATQEIRNNAQGPNANAIIVALTAFSDERIVNQSSKSGVNYFITKPLSMEGVKSVLERFKLI